MNAELWIPSRALGRAYEALLSAIKRGLDRPQTSASIIYAAAPPIVAAELTRFADSIADRMAQPDLGVDGDYTPTVASVLDELRARAAELSAS